MKSKRTRRSAATSAAHGDRWHIYAIAPDSAARAELAMLAAARPESLWQEFPGGHDFLTAATGLPPGCVLILDPLADIETLALVSWLAQQRPDISSIVASSRQSATLAVTCLKAGATDFVARPLGHEAALAALTAVFEPAPERPTRGMALRRQLMTSRLSFRELEVLEALIAGLSNKEVGAKLHISERTVEVHRSRIMRRLEVDSFAELVRMAVRAGLDTA